MLTLAEIYDGLFQVAKGRKQGAWRSAFAGERKDVEAKLTLLRNQYVENNGSEEWDEVAMADAIRDTVKSYTRDKDNLILVYKQFCAYINKTYGITIPIEYPPIPIMNSFERYMFIAKYLHKAEHRISDLEDVLWQSGRTIEKDIEKLRGTDTDPIQVCGKPFILTESNRSRDHITCASTVHPFFLTSNLTQVITMLSGLRVMSEKPEFGEYARMTARDIWQIGRAHV